MKSRYIDFVTLYIRSGRGGNGSMSFRREKYIPLGGPDGGDGGKGGDIIFRVNRNIFTLNHLRYTHHLFAEDGGGGQRQKMHGKDGENVVIEVPPGTVVMDLEKNEILELMEGDYTYLEGGRGGRGNVHFKSSVNRTPQGAEKGRPGKEEQIILELRLIADVGLVGMPNAGKSTFLKTVTNANPKIADYPFTTLEPNLGILSDGVNIVRIADIPGIIEGAAQGRGLGNRFLKHISRVRLLLFMVDISSEDPLEVYKTLTEELSGYDKKLLRKKRILVFNKTDLVSGKRLEEISRIKFDVPVVFTSLINGDKGNVENLIIAELYGQNGNN